MIAVKNGKNILLMRQLLKNVFRLSLHNEYIFTLATILVMQRYILFVVPVILALLLSSVTATIIMIGQPVFAQGGPSACPDPGQCTCNPATGVMTDHAMPPPFNRINNGCTERGSF
jgi:hypothetical protein